MLLVSPESILESGMRQVPDRVGTEWPRNLEVLLDPELLLDAYVTVLAMGVFYQLRLIFELRTIFSKGNLAMIIKAPQTKTRLASTSTFLMVAPQLSGGIPSPGRLTLL